MDQGLAYRKNANISLNVTASKILQWKATNMALVFNKISVEKKNSHHFDLSWCSTVYNFKNFCVHDLRIFIVLTKYVI